MPLESGGGRAAFGHNVKTEMNAGKPQKQAVAIAYSKQRGDARPGDQVGQPPWVREIYGEPDAVSQNPSDPDLRQLGEHAKALKDAAELMGKRMDAMEREDAAYSNGPFSAGYSSRIRGGRRGATPFPVGSSDNREWLNGWDSKDAEIRKIQAKNVARGDEWSEEARKAAAEARKKGGGSKTKVSGGDDPDRNKGAYKAGRSMAENGESFEESSAVKKMSPAQREIAHRAFKSYSNDDD